MCTVLRVELMRKEAIASEVPHEASEASERELPFQD